MPTCTVPDCSNKPRKTRPTCTTHNYYDISDHSTVVICRAQNCYGWRGIANDVEEASRLLSVHKKIDHGVPGQKGYR